MEPQYIINPRPRSRGNRIIAAGDIAVSLRRKHRDTGRRLSGGGLTFRMVEDDGVDEQTLEIRQAHNGERGLDEFGHPSTVPHLYITRSQTGVHKHIRQLRDKDAGELAVIDDRLEELKRQLKEVRTERSERMKAAWANAQEVPLRDIVALLP